MNWFEIKQIKPKGVEAVKLDPKTRKGELTFKVTNVSGKALRAGAVVFPQADEQKAWMSIKGEEIQEMGEDSEKTIAVGIAAPREAMPGEYCITFVVCNEANPEEETAEVKAEFKIDTPAEQAVSRFWQYRWHYLAAGLVVGIVVLIVWLIPGRKARFLADRYSGSAYLMVKFSDNSAGEPNSWEWDFGDKHTSDEQNPTHFYGLYPNDSYPKTYNVSLTIDGKEDTKTTKEITVTEPKLKADFEIFKPSAFGISDANQFGISTAIALVNERVFFHNLSTGEPSKFEWDFGDGVDSNKNKVDPYHVYEKKGTYEVKLDVSGGKGRSYATGTVRILERIGEPIAADFEHKRDYEAAEPYAVKFTDKSEPKPNSWEWDFGDGSTSGEPDPNHVYEHPGTYNVKLTVWGEVVDIEDMKKPSVPKQVEVTVEDKKPDKKDDEKLIARFSCDRRQGRLDDKEEFKVHFADRSGGSPNSGEWDFDIDTDSDKDKSEKQHPSYTYKHPGTYGVTLTVRVKEKTIKKEDTIYVPGCIKVTKEAMPPVAEFTVKKALFENGTERVPTDYARFTFEKADLNPKEGKAIKPVPSIEKILTGQTVEFIDLSKGDVKNWSWNFGDGTPVSEERDPNHTFNRVGTFDVTLTVTGSGGKTDKKTKAHFVQVYPRTKVQTIEPNEIPKMRLCPQLPFKGSEEPNEIPMMCVCPQRLLKGSDFHGPGAEFTVAAMLKKEARDVYAYLSMYIKMSSGMLDEVVPNGADPRMYDIVAKGVVTKRIFTAPRGWKVNRIITMPTSLCWAGKDEADKVDYKEKEMSWCEFRLMGDTWGDDIGQKDNTQSHMIVDIVEPIKIELIEE